MTEFEASLIGEIKIQTALLDAIVSLLSQPAETECQHPEEARQNLSSMGQHWVRCSACKADLIKQEGPKS